MATNNVDSGGGGSSSEEQGQPGRRAIPEEVLDCIRAVVSELLDQQRQLASTGSGSSNATGTAPAVPTPSGLPPLDALLVTLGRVPVLEQGQLKLPMVCVVCSL